MKQIIYAIKSIDEEDKRFAYLDVTENVFRYADLLELENDIEHSAFFITANFDNAKKVLINLLENKLWKENIIKGNIFIEEIEINMTINDTYRLSKKDL